MNTIDMTPTAEESIRIYAYILANHANLSPFDFGDYWNYNEAQVELITKAFNAYVQLTEAVRTKFIKSAMNI
jgi:hypothetical protein